MRSVQVQVVRVVIQVASKGVDDTCEEHRQPNLTPQILLILLELLRPSTKLKTALVGQPTTVDEAVLLIWHCDYLTTIHKLRSAIIVSATAIAAHLSC